MKMLLFSAVALAAVAGIAPALAYSAPAPHHEMKAMTRAEMMQKVQDHFATLDSNKDGFVTKEEMEAGRSAIHERMADHRKERASGMFDRMDSNHDGSITRAEFDAAHAAMGGRMGKMHMAMRGMHGGMAGHMFATADSNKDGRVSLQEANAAAAAHFDRLDANHDGTVTPGEMRAAHKAMRGKGGR
jgi:Ca2+-binding EF-hand superfamily protein